MEQVLVKSSFLPQKNPSNTIETFQKKCARKVSDILSVEFYHSQIPINKSVIGGLRTSKLMEIYRFLTQEVIQLVGEDKRPECPIKNPRQQSLARYEYKSAMIKYIEGFGCILEGNPCEYGASFLEALANYCEHRNREGGKGTKSLSSKSH